MRIRRILIIISLNFYFAVCAQERLQYHPIITDDRGLILPWYHNDPAIAYDRMIQIVWRFWDTMRTDLNGLPYYMNHQVWRESRNDPRGIGGDQIAMALESWRLLYAYSGDERIKENMRFMVDYYLSHSLTKSDDQWAFLPYPYNDLIYSGIYDGDMILGKGYIQPDKAGSLAIELLRLYKMTADEIYPNKTKEVYLESAIQIANSLAGHTRLGDENNSPLPFKVHAKVSTLGALYEKNARGQIDTVFSNYTTNWSGTMELWLELKAMKLGDTLAYDAAFRKIWNWMMTYPMRNNKWGPFFEDVPGWSDTQINAITFAQFIMNHKELFPNWESVVHGIFDWVYRNLGNKKWEAYGVIPINEQTAYRVPGNSHTSRQAAAQLQYAALNQNDQWVEPSVRQLNWATYMVDHDGKNKYLQDEVWLTDGYGDYVRHYLKAMRFRPELAPNETHILGSSSIVQHAFYKGGMDKYYFPHLPDTNRLLMHYTCFDAIGMETIRLKNKLSRVLFDGKPISLDSHALKWEALKSGFLLTIKRTNNRHVSIYE